MGLDSGYTFQSVKGRVRDGHGSRCSDQVILVPLSFTKLGLNSTLTRALNSSNAMQMQ